MLNLSMSAICKIDPSHRILNARGKDAATGDRGTMHNTPQDFQTQFFNAEQLAASLGIHRSTLLREAARGRIPYRRIGRRYFFCRTSFEAWMQGSDSPATDPVDTESDTGTRRGPRTRIRGSFGSNAERTAERMIRERDLLHHENLKG